MHHLRLVGRQFVVHQQVEHRHDTVERCADFVAHGGQEFALGHHRRFGVLLGLPQLLFQLAAALQLALQLAALGFAAGGDVRRVAHVLLVVA